MKTKITDLSGFIGKGLSRGIIDGWIKAQKKYVKEADETPWAFNERASVSTLAAGCWLAGGVALEEYSTEKQHGDRRFSSKRAGRGDIYLRHQGKEFNCEAKWRWLAIPFEHVWDAEKTAQTLAASFSSAANDAERLVKGFGKREVLLFVSVYHWGNKLDRPGIKNAKVFVEGLTENLRKTGAVGMA